MHPRADFVDSVRPFGAHRITCAGGAHTLDFETERFCGALTSDGITLEPPRPSGSIFPTGAHAGGRYGPPFSSCSSRVIMKNLTTFSAVHASGMVIPNRSTVTAMCLLFDKIYLPANIESVREFAKNYKIRIPSSGESKKRKLGIGKISDNSGKESDPFASLTAQERLTARNYLEWCVRFSIAYSELFPKVFETNGFQDGSPLKATLVKKGAPGELNTYNVSIADLLLTEGDGDLFPKLLDKGYLPIVTSDVRLGQVRDLDTVSSKQLAALLGMKAVEMIFPRTKPASPELILEARDRLKDHLPQFWSSMFKLTNDLKKLHEESSKQHSLLIDAENLVDTTVRPALLDLKHKLEAERKQWFHHILSPIQNGLRLLVGNPPLTQQQLITNALILASDATSSAANHHRTIESLKQNSGLTYLLELDKLQSEP